MIDNHSLAAIITDHHHHSRYNHPTDRPAGYEPDIHTQDSRQTENSRMTSATQHQEAFYLFIVGGVGVLLNVVVITAIIVRRTLRKMTSAFLIHACFLNLLKAAFCLPFGLHLLGGSAPKNCSLEGSAYVIVVTTSAFNMLAMVCAEAYTLGEHNVAGRWRGSCCCVLFGVLMVYVSSVVLHLGPTLIGGYFQYNPLIGNCSFRMGEATGYIASVMWIAMVTLSLVATSHFLCKMYKDLRENPAGRVAMAIADRPGGVAMETGDHHGSSVSTLLNHSTGGAGHVPDKVCCHDIRIMLKDASHRAKIFVIMILAFVISWYPLFLLIIIDVNFKVSAKVYQAFSFIAWSQGMVEPLILICFDRHLRLLAYWVYCDRYKQDYPDPRDATTARLMGHPRSHVSSHDCVCTLASNASTAYNSIAHSRDGAATYPYPYHHRHHQGAWDGSDHGRPSPSLHTESPSPPPPAAPAPPVPAAAATGRRKGGAPFDKQSEVRHSNSTAGQHHSVAASLELDLPDDVHC